MLDDTKWAVVCALLLVSSITLAACAAATRQVGEDPTSVEVPQGAKATQSIESATSSRGDCGTLTLLYWQAASTMNAYLAGGGKDVHAASIVLEPLARYDEAGRLVPWLAVEIPTLANGGISEDLRSITWKLKPDILWADGTPVTAEDVVFSAEYCLHPEMGCAALADFADVERVEALDDRTVVITFSVPKPFPYGPLVSSSSPILQKAQFERCTGAAAQECATENFYPIGTGPFKVREFKANDVIVYDLNEHYREPDKPCFSKVVLKGGGDATAAARAVLETGEADYAWNLQVAPQVLSAMEGAGAGASKGTVVVSFGTGVERLTVNMTNPDPALGENRSTWTPDNRYPHPFMREFNVRKALSMSIDRPAIASQLYGAAGKATCNLLAGPPVYVSTANDVCLTQDIPGANALLDEAGWLPGPDGIRQKDGVRLSILYQTSTNVVRQSTQALIKQWWSQIGVETELRNVEATVFFGGDPASPDTIFKFYADIQMYTGIFRGTDPERFMAHWVEAEIPREANQWLGINTARWTHPDYDALVAEFARAAELSERVRIAKAQNDMLVGNYVVIPLVHRGDVSAHANSLLGVRMNSYDSELWNIADWSRDGR